MMSNVLPRFFSGHSVYGFLCWLTTELIIYMTCVVADCWQRASEWVNVAAAAADAAADDDDDDVDDDDACC